MNYFVHKELTILRENVAEDTKQKNLNNIHQIRNYITVSSIYIEFIKYSVKQYKEYVGKDLITLIGKFLLEGSNIMYEINDRIF